MPSEEGRASEEAVVHRHRLRKSPGQYLASKGTTETAVLSPPVSSSFSGTSLRASVLIFVAILGVVVHIVVAIGPVVLLL